MKATHLNNVLHKFTAPRFSYQLLHPIELYCNQIILKVFKYILLDDKQIFTCNYQPSQHQPPLIELHMTTSRILRQHSHNLMPFSSIAQGMHITCMLWQTTDSLKVNSCLIPFSWHHDPDWFSVGQRKTNRTLKRLKHENTFKWSFCKGWPCIPLGDAKFVFCVIYYSGSPSKDVWRIVTKSTTKSKKQNKNKTSKVAGGGTVDTHHQRLLCHIFNRTCRLNIDACIRKVGCNLGCVDFPSQWTEKKKEISNAVEATSTAFRSFPLPLQVNVVFNTHAPYLNPCSINTARVVWSLRIDTFSKKLLKPRHNVFPISVLLQCMSMSPYTIN